jgi:hypothetical protein
MRTFWAFETSNDLEVVAADSIREAIGKTYGYLGDHVLYREVTATKVLVTLRADGSWTASPALPERFDRIEMSDNPSHWSVDALLVPKGTTHLGTVVARELTGPRPGEEDVVVTVNCLTVGPLQAALIEIGLYPADVAAAAAATKSEIITLVPATAIVIRETGR